MALPLTIGRGHHGTLGHHRGPTFSTTDSSAHTLSQTSPVTSREFKLSSEDVGGGELCRMWFSLNFRGSFPAQRRTSRRGIFPPMTRRQQGGQAYMCAREQLLLITQSLL